VSLRSVTQSVVGGNGHATIVPAIGDNAVSAAEVCRAGEHLASRRVAYSGS
jgi:hypothetical protein